MTKASDVYSFAILLLELWSGTASHTDQNYYGVSLQSHICNTRVHISLWLLPASHAHMLRGSENVICSRIQEVHSDQPISEPGCTAYAYACRCCTACCAAAGGRASARVISPSHPLAYVAWCTCAQMLYSVLNGCRPSVPADSPAAYRVLLEDCWAADPVLRPTFTAILDRLTALLAATKDNGIELHTLSRSAGELGWPRRPSPPSSTGSPLFSLSRRTTSLSHRP